MEASGGRAIYVQMTLPLVAVWQDGTAAQKHGVDKNGHALETVRQFYAVPYTCQY